jgi:C_GCAxxG_C_C family probable redox protein
MRGVCHAQGIELVDQAKRAATPFGGGIGRSEDLCGAISGGVIAIGVCGGRALSSEDRLVSYDIGGRFYKLFVDKFRSASCKVLNRSDFKSPEHRIRCGQYVSGATVAAIQALREK